MATRPVGSNPRVWMDITIDGIDAGRVTFELRNDIAGKTCENFRALCTGEKGIGRVGKPLHFKGSEFHRIVPSCVIQGGDITRGDGTGGESIYPGNKDGTFEDECFTLRHTGPGCLSMVNAGPDSNRSMFFITLAEIPWMDDNHVVFGYVCDGMEVIRKMEAVGSPSGLPQAEVRCAACGQCDDVIKMSSGGDAYTTHKGR